jgi:tetratricopeptide (TPR) repeat protein
MKLLQEHGRQRADGYEWTVYTTWQISFEKLSSKAASFLQLCAFMHHDGISEEIFRTATATTFENIPSSATDFLCNFQNGNQWDTARFLDVTNKLRKYSLIDFDHVNKVFSIHPLVHTWMRDANTNGEITWTLTGSILAMSVNWEDGLDDQMFRRTLLPHVEMVLWGHSFTDAEVSARLWLVYFESGHWKEAEKLAVQVMETRKRVLGAEHLDTLTSIANLASTYRNQGRWKEAEQLEVQVMEMRKRVLGAEHPDTLTSMANLASTYSDQGQWKEAEGLEVQVMEMRKRVLGAEHLDTLTSMGNLALTYWNQERWKEAEGLEVQVMETRKRVLGVEHPDTLTIMANLALTYRKQGQWKEAEGLEVLVVEMRKRVLGAEHPDTLTSMANLTSTSRIWGWGRRLRGWIRKIRSGH